MYRQASSSRLPSTTGPTEFDILKASHKFLRDESAGEDASWEDRLAQKYYASLYREFAVCDLKHYKSGNFALRWRTESEVLSGAGEETCGNTRCRHYDPLDASRKALKTVELPFAYEEHGERKNALVKVVLCTSCLKKLMWKHERGKEARRGVDIKKEEEEGEGEGAGTRVKELMRKSVGVKEEEDEEEIENMLKSKTSGMDDVYERRRRSDKRRERRDEDSSRRRRRSSRSLSPSSRREREHEHKHKRKQRSPTTST